MTLMKRAMNGDLKKEEVITGVRFQYSFDEGKTW
jgi:hypothetical protein